MHTLEKYATENFRTTAAITTVSSTLNSVRRHTKDELWRHTRDPIKSPHLLKLQKDRTLFDKSVIIFNLILKYMGDLPSGKTTIDTDLIFGPAINDELVRDEVYCQLMRQLTENRIQVSEERGWELMWLATGVMLPSSQLLKELNEFLKTRTHLFAKESLQRIQKTLKNGSRSYPPYIIEVEAIQHKTIDIYHKVYFPDDSDEAFNIESSTKAGDLVQDITSRLKLKSSEGFSLFVKVMDKVVSVPEHEYMFDFIYRIIQYVKEDYPTKLCKFNFFLCIRNGILNFRVKTLVDLSFNFKNNLWWKAWTNLPILDEGKKRSGLTLKIAF